MVSTLDFIRLSLVRFFFWGLILVSIFFLVYEFLIGIPIKKIKIDHIRYITPHEIQMVLEKSIQGTFLTIDISKIKAIIQKLPWVEAVYIQRLWPGVIEIKITEYVPLGRWNQKALLDEHGHIFQAPYDKKLPNFIGIPGNEIEIANAYLQFRRILTPIQRMITVVGLATHHFWEIQLDNGLTIKLGTSKIIERLNRFIQVSKQMPALIQSHSPIEYIDLRYKTGFALKFFKTQTL